MKRMLDSMSFRTAASRWDLPESGYNLGCPAMQLTEQLLAVSIWCGAVYSLRNHPHGQHHGTAVRLACGRAQSHRAPFKRFDMLYPGGCKPASTAGFSTRHIVLARQSIKRKAAPGKTLFLFVGDTDIKGWRYGAMVTSLSLPSVEEWRSYRGRAGCENRTKELKDGFGLGSFSLNSFYATKAALGFAMLAYNLMSTFRQSVMRTRFSLRWRRYTNRCWLMDFGLNR